LSQINIQERNRCNHTERKNLIVLILNAYKIKEHNLKLN